jgi:hypothetical protein
LSVGAPPHGRERALPPCLYTRRPSRDLEFEFRRFARKAILDLLRVGILQAKARPPFVLDRLISVDRRIFNPPPQVNRRCTHRLLDPDTLSIDKKTLIAYQGNQGLRRPR